MTQFEKLSFCSGSNLSILFDIRLGGMELKKLFLLTLYFLIYFLHTLKDNMFLSFRCLICLTHFHQSPTVKELPEHKSFGFESLLVTHQVNDSDMNNSRISFIIY